MAELYFHYPIVLQGVVLNLLNTGIILPNLYIYVYAVARMLLIIRLSLCSSFFHCVVFTHMSLKAGAMKYMKDTIKQTT
jgi:hypothetical protein